MGSPKSAALFAAWCFVMVESCVVPVLATRAECAEEHSYLQRELAAKDRELSELRRIVREQRLALQALRTACAVARQPAASIEQTDAWPQPTSTAASA